MMRVTAQISLLLLVINAAEASLPARYPENNWRALSALLMDKSISADWKAPDGRSIIALQLLYGSEERAIALVRKKGKRNISKIDGDDGFMSLAISVGSQRMVQTLLSLGESSNAVRGIEEPPLMEAAYFGRLEIMRMLISAGADVNYANTVGEGAVHRALQRGHGMAFNILVDAGLNLEKLRADEVKDSLVHQAVYGGSLQAIQSLAENGFDLSSIRSNGDTPLTYAVTMLASNSVVETLLSYGADPCVVNADGRLPEQLISSEEKYRKHFGDYFEGACEKFKKIGK
jgi:ankyrin repeat protein